MTSNIKACTHFPEKIVPVFIKFALHDKCFMQTLSAHGFTFSSQHWDFTLPQLFRSLALQDSYFSNLSYLEFRKLLFNSPVNQQLAQHHAKIIISNNQKNVDQSLYTLQLTDPLTR